MSESNDIIRDSFVAIFGEDDAATIEAAAEEHLSDSIHTHDNYGGSKFRYLFLGAIGYGCVDEYREAHGITASTEDMKSWALADGRLGEHDGDVPDYLALIVGVYSDWMYKAVQS